MIFCSGKRTPRRPVYYVLGTMKSSSKRIFPWPRVSRFQIPGLLLVFLIFLASLVDSEKNLCGGHLKAQRGVIHTPNFPSTFPVPIKCRWIIDASDMPSTNGSTVVYLTQVFVFKGLSFTEYAYYESESINYGSSVVKLITEGNIFVYRWLRTFRPFLAIDFQLDRLEGNHVRVLDDLLDVYGFNITYEMTENDANTDSCSVRDCSFVGHCRLSADYEIFYCDCFDEFHGENCGIGPLCIGDNGLPVCQNDGTCRHMGAAAVRCLCPRGFSGELCQIPPTDNVESGCPDGKCILQCPYSEHDYPCQCNDATPIYNNRSRFECRIKLTNVTSLRTNLIVQHGSLESLLGRQLSKYLRNANITTAEDLKILKVTPTSEITFHFFGNSFDGDKIREALNRLVKGRRLNDISLESTHFTFQQKPALRLQSLRLDQINGRQVQLGNQFVLSCVAQGSYGMNFTWYKDNMLVNMSKSTREIWYRHLPNDGSDYQISVLTIDQATLLDTGRYTCQVAEWGMQQCKSIYVEIKGEPEVKIHPMSTTVGKGSNVQLTCMTRNMRSIGIGFGWTKNRALLKLELGSEVWEDLYPAGSILKITNIQKSAVYRCNVAHRSMAVRVEVVNRTVIPICSKEESWGLRWLESAPGSEALLECPKGYVGQRVSRLCSMKDATSSEWQIPDFSDCLYEPLIAPYKNFQSLKLGFQNTTGPSTILTLWEVLQMRTSPLNPGEGDRIIGLIAEVMNYQYTMNNLLEVRNSAESLMKIVNRILNSPHSILSQQKLLQMKQLLYRNLAYYSKSDVQRHLPLSAIVVDIQPLKVQSGIDVEHTLQIPSDRQERYPEWYNEKTILRIQRKQFRNSNNSISGIVIVYKNLTQFFPDTCIRELPDGTDLEYRINSRVISIFTSPYKSDKEDVVFVDLTFSHLQQNYSAYWNITCGIMDAVSKWDMNTCAVTSTSFETSTTNCLCPSTGTYALFLTNRATKVVLAKKEQTTYVVMLGCSSCLLQCLVSILVLTAFWWKDRTWLNFLKLQCCGAIIAAMAIFIYAAQNTISKSALSIVATSLEAFLLIGTSAPISQAMIIYAELANIRPSQHLQPTVIAVITGVPILAILATELTHKSTGWQHESWWLISGSGVYNIFITCSIVLLLIFVLLYIGVLQKTHPAADENLIKRETVETRMRMLHKTAVIVCGIIAMEASSILYINSSSIIYHYVFAALSALLGFIILATYVMSGEVMLIAPLLHKWNYHSDNDEDGPSEPIKVCTKVGVEVENEAAPPPMMAEPFMEARGVAAGIDMREYITESNVFPKSSIPRATNRFLPEIRVDYIGDDINLENYTASPRKKYPEPMVLDSSFSTPHHFKSREFVMFSPRPPEPRVEGAEAPAAPECSAKVLCNAEVESRVGIGAMPDVTLAVKSEERTMNVELKSREVGTIPDIANTAERKQPDGEEKSTEVRLTEATSTVMLDRISHDLDYLLNRTKEDA